jgi:hypothetical protein
MTQQGTRLHLTGRVPLPSTSQPISPRGCVHQNTTLLYTTLHDRTQPPFPSTNPPHARRQGRHVYISEGSVSFLKGTRSTAGDVRGRVRMEKDGSRMQIPRGVPGSNGLCLAGTE